MPPHLIDFVAAYGWGPFVLIGYLMLAAFIRVFAGQDGCWAMLAGSTLLMGFAFSLYRAYDPSVIAGLFYDRDIAAQASSGLSRGYRFRSASAGGDPGDGSTYWHYVIPPIIGFAYAILLPARAKWLGVVGGGLWLTLYALGALDVFERPGEVQPVDVAREYAVWRFEAIRDEVLSMIDVLTAPGEAGEAPTGVDQSEPTGPRYPDGVSPLPAPRP